MEAGFFPNGYNFGGFDGGGGNVPSIYSPFMATTADSQKRNCHPLKISMIVHGHKNTNRLVVDGQEVAVFKLVGLLTNFEFIEDGGAEKFSFDISDSTGTIKVDWLVGIKSEPNSAWLKRDLDAFEQHAPNSYVKVFGESYIRGSQEPRIKAVSVQRITEPHEIFLHDLDVMWTRIYFMGPPLATKLDEVRRIVNPNNFTSLPKVQLEISKLKEHGQIDHPKMEITPSLVSKDELEFMPKEQQSLFAPARISSLNTMKAPAPVISNPTAEDDDAEDDDDDDDDDIDTTICRYLQVSRAAHPEGVSVKIIVRHTGIRAPLVKQALQSLLDKGEACRTPDNLWASASD